MDINSIRASLSGRMAAGFDIYPRREGAYQLIIPICHEDGDMVDIYLQESPRGEAYIRICDLWQSYFGYDCHHGLQCASSARTPIDTDRRGQATGLAAAEAVASAVLAGRSRLYGPVRDRFAAEYRDHQGRDARQPAAAGHPDQEAWSQEAEQPRNLLLRLASRWREVLAFMTISGCRSPTTRRSGICG